jgi:ABC-type uncharacterized transport system involved in gliding motility auxiliary subunit
MNSLSDQSVKLLQSLEEELKVVYFYKEGMEESQQSKKAFQNLVRRYQDMSSKLTLDFVEVNKRPDLVEQYEVTKGSGVAFVEYKGKRNTVEKMDKPDEQALTGAIVKVMRQKDRVVYLVTGHGEGGVDNVKDAHGLSQLKSVLEGNRYQLKPLQLAISPEVPQDADVVLVVAPRQSFLDLEIKALEKYLQNGGSVFFALDPGTNHGLSPLLEKIGVRLENNYVLTVMKTAYGTVADPSATPGTVFSTTSKITQPFTKEMVLFYLPQALEKGTPPSGAVYDEIVRTDANFMAFTNNKFEGEGKVGPFALVTSIKGKLTAESKEFQVVVAGDSDFLSNQFLFRNINRDLLLNSILTLAKEENMVSITPKEIAATEMTLTENKFYIFIFAFVIPLPLLMAVTSGVLWYRRRNA